MESNSEPKIENSPAPPASEKTLEEIVAESKQNLAEEPPKKLKRGRGRPRKEEAKNPEVVPPEPAGPPPMSLVPVLKQAVKLPYTIAAKRTKFQGFELDDEEAGMLATQVDQIMLRYLPNLGEGTSLIAVCVASFAMITMNKMAVYEEHKKVLRTNQPATNVHNTDITQPPMVVDGPPVESNAFFN